MILQFDCNNKVIQQRNPYMHDPEIPLGQSLYRHESNVELDILQAFILIFSHVTRIDRTQILSETLTGTIGNCKQLLSDLSMFLEISFFFVLLFSDPPPPRKKTLVHRYSAGVRHSNQIVLCAFVLNVSITTKLILSFVSTYDNNFVYMTR